MNGQPYTKSENEAKSRRISIGFEELLFELQQKGKQKDQIDYDVIVIGSGYGGSIAAAELSSSKDVSVCVLERGNEYHPGSFPKDLSEMGGHVRFNTGSATEAKGNPDGIFDFRLGNHMSALVGNGLGGGSLINAGVMEMPKPQVFNHQWPEALRDIENLHPYFDRVKKDLGALTKTSKNLAEELVDNSVALHEFKEPQKCRTLQALKPKNWQSTDGEFKPAALTIAMEEKNTISGLQLDPCNYCGDCATGCNYNAKESLDTNLLDLAYQREATIVTGATVIRLERDQADTWNVVVRYTDNDLHKREGTPTKLTASKVILAAGTFGSTEILKRSQSKTLQFSHQLGERFSGNGDTIAFVYDQKVKAVNAVAKEEVPPGKRKIGPTITSMLNPVITEHDPFVVQEMAVPNSLRQIFEETVTTSNLLHKLKRSDNSRHHNLKNNKKKDPLVVDDDAIKKTSILAVFGDDQAQGSLHLVGDKSNLEGNGCITVDWPEIKNAPLFNRQINYLERLCNQSEISGKVIPNPMWKFLPNGLDFLAEGDLRGPSMTVHPLGGCAMADKLSDGVVNNLGKVFNPNPDPDSSDPEKHFHNGLIVLDGSIIPTALAINPALTIAAVSLRAIGNLISLWGWENECAQINNASPPKPNQDTTSKRAFYRKVEDSYSQNPPSFMDRTAVQLVERLGGKVTIHGKPYYLEITARYKPTSIMELARGKTREIKIDSRDKRREDDSRIRLFRFKDWSNVTNGNEPVLNEEMRLDKHALFIAPLSGTLEVFNRESSNFASRRVRAIPAWLFNRGLRDIYQAVEKRFKGSSETNKLKIGSRIKSAWALSSRAGEIRTVKYKLKIGKASQESDFIKTLPQLLSQGTTLSGKKRFTYSRRSNPWRQLMELELENWQNKGKPATIALDTRFLAKQGVPLIRISRQQDQPSALMDCLSFIGYVARLILSVHIWSFRQPDAINPATPQRLPGPIGGLPTPEIKELVTGRTDQGKPAKIRLTRYKNPYNANALPIVMIHGYSASGTSFAHPSVNPNLAGYFHKAGHDIWILDLRTSCGMLTATEDWKFEDVALNDIPAAFNYVHQEVGGKFNVLAHCMGAAMFSMAVLNKPHVDQLFYKELKALPCWINRVVLSQVGPRVQFSPDNVFRGYLLNYLLHYLPLTDYQFRLEGDLNLTDRLFDRLLSTLPYPEEEFDAENPPYRFWRKTNFTRSRHRMDALYGRDFNIQNIDEDVLHHIDDFFGPLSLVTVSQAIHFSRWNLITTPQGNNDYVSRKNLEERWTFDTFSVHGEKNGLADVKTVALMEQTLKDAGRYFDSHIQSNYGHQDCLIGKSAEEVFDKIKAFYDRPQVDSDRPRQTSTQKKQPSTKLCATPPWIGPHLRKRKNGEVRLKIGATPGMQPPPLTVFVPVIKKVDRFERTPNTRLATRMNRPSNVSQLDNALSTTTDNYLPLGLFTAIQREGLVEFRLSDQDFSEGSDGVLIFFIYDDDPLLNDSNFGNSYPDYDWIQSINLMTFDPAIKLEISIPDEVSKFIKNVIAELQLKRLTPKIEQAIDEQLQKEAKQLLRCFLEKPQPHRDMQRRNNNKVLQFILGSCQYPAGLLDHKPAYNSFHTISRLIKAGEKSPSFLLLLGDQVYVDATAGLFDPVVLEDRIRQSHQRLYTQWPVRNVLRRIPVYSMLDDHEINNNWEPINIDTDNTNLQLMEEGREGFIYWQGNETCSHSETKYDCDTEKDSKLFYSFEENGFQFFIADSRTERTHREVTNFKEASILGDEQTAKLYKWLKLHKTDPKPKFIASPAMLFPRRQEVAYSTNDAAALKSDEWTGYPKSLHNLMLYITLNQITNVFFLSGDAHLSLDSTISIEFTPPGQEKPEFQSEIRSIHSSGFYSPYPFANSFPEDFVFIETFHFHIDESFKLDPQIENLDRPEEIRFGTLTYHVTTPSDRVAPPNGFAAISVEPSGKGWQVSAEFLPNKTTTPKIESK